MYGSAPHFVCQLGLKNICTFQPQEAQGMQRHGRPSPPLLLAFTSGPRIGRYPTIYVQSSSLGDFVAFHLPTIPGRFVLITGLSDAPIDPQLPAYRPLFDSPKLVQAYAQNGCCTHSKLTILPIGIDYHTGMQPTLFGMGKVVFHQGSQPSPEEQDAQLRRISKGLKHFSQRIPSCFSNFDDKCESRKLAHKEVSQDLVRNVPTGTDRMKTWEEQGKHAFVISPIGNGLDCHRTWEALALGCIAIVDRTPISPVFEDLPVLIVDRWSEVTRERLDKTLIEFGERSFNMDKLTLKYWKDKITAH